MIVSATTETYAKAFTENYTHLLRFCNGDEDKLHDTFLKVGERLKVITFTAYTETILNEKLIAYIKTGLWNYWKTEERLKKHTVAPEDCNQELENKLLQDEIYCEDKLNRQQELEYIAMRLFNYVKTKYGVEYHYIFSTYYLLNDKKITYQQLSKITGYSISKCCNVIKTIKNDVKLNLNKEL